MASVEDNQKSSLNDAYLFDQRDYGRTAEQSLSDSQPSDDLAHQATLYRMAFSGRTAEEEILRRHAAGELAPEHTDRAEQLSQEAQNERDQQIVQGLSSVGQLVLSQDDLQRLQANAAARSKFRTSQTLDDSQKRDLFARTFASDAEIRRSAQPIPPEQIAQSPQARKARLLAQLDPSIRNEPWQYDPETDSLQMPRGYRKPEPSAITGYFDVAPEHVPANEQPQEVKSKEDFDRINVRKGVKFRYKGQEYATPGPAETPEQETARKKRELIEYGKKWIGPDYEERVSRGDRFSHDAKGRYVFDPHATEAEFRRRQQEAKERAEQYKLEHPKPEKSDPAQFRLNLHKHLDEYAQKLREETDKRITSPAEPATTFSAAKPEQFVYDRRWTDEEIDRKVAARRSEILQDMGRSPTSPAGPTATTPAQPLHPKIVAAIQAARSGDKGAQDILDRNNITWRPPAKQPSTSSPRARNFSTKTASDGGSRDGMARSSCGPRQTDPSRRAIAVVCPAYSPGLGTEGPCRCPGSRLARPEICQPAVCQGQRCYRLLGIGPGRSSSRARQARCLDTESRVISANPANRKPTLRKEKTKRPQIFHDPRPRRPKTRT